MRCEDVANLLLPALEGVLPPADVEAVEIHVGGCAACAHDLPKLQQLWRVLDAWEDEDVPDELIVRTRHRLGS